jgi:hypothetical protein
MLRQNKLPCLFQIRFLSLVKNLVLLFQNYQSVGQFKELLSNWFLPCQHVIYKFVRTNTLDYFWVGVRGKEKGFKASKQSQQRLDKMSTKPLFVNQWDDATTGR